MTTDLKPVIYFVESREEVFRYLKTRDQEILSADFDFVFCASSNIHQPSLQDIVITIKCASPGVLLEVSTLAVNCKAICLVDGVVEWRNSYENPFYRNSKYKLYHENVFDYYLCVHGQSFNALSDLGLPVIRINDFEHQVIADAPPVKIEKFLVTTARQPFFDGVEKDTLQHELKRICDYLNDNGKDFKLRIFDDVLMSQLEPYKDKNNVQEGLDEAIAGVDAIFTTPSTISLDVIAQKKPVIHIDLRDGPLLFQSGWRLTPSYPIERVMSSITDEARLKFQSLNLIPIESNRTDFLRLTIDGQKIAVRRTLATINSSPLNINLEVTIKRFLKKMRVFTWLRTRILSKYFAV